MLKRFRITVNIVISNSQVNMLNKDLRKFLTNLTMGLALSTTVNITLPSVSLAQKQPGKSTSSIATDYLLGGGDRIRVNVFEVPEYTGEYQEIGRASCRERV